MDIVNRMHEDGYGFQRYRTTADDESTYMMEVEDSAIRMEDNQDAEDNMSTNESTSSNLKVTPNGTSTWIPKVPDHLKINVGAQFENIDSAYNAYDKYAEAAGFTIRLSSSKLYTDNTVRKKYILCSKAGKPQKQIVDTVNASGRERKKRNSSFKVSRCPEAIILFRDQKTGVFTVGEVREAHNHILNVDNSNNMSRRKRQLKYFDQQFIVRAATRGMGPTMAHGFNATLKGGYDCIQPSKVDYSNFWRDFCKHVGENDAQCIVDEMTVRKETFPNFTFEYKLDGNELSAMFWADEVAKANYKEFFDVISFDATFRHNKYDMVFVPFTAIDHHKKSVNVGAALLAHETIENYTWLLKAFLIAHGTPPTLVLSDQDPTMKQAISNIFPDSTHRLCMWHIMGKMRIKLNPSLINNTDFTKRLNKLVWNVFLEPEGFEIGWTSLMDEYNLNDHQWLRSMFQIRHSWIPAYFKHIPNCGLMKTTSRSESSNSFFNTFSRHGNMLVNFMMNFDTTLEKQRLQQRALDDFTSRTKPSLLTDTEVELHASKVYTREVFLEVQKEIKKAMSKCFQEQMYEENGVAICTIVYKSKKTGVKTYHKVEYIKDVNVFKCPCDHYNRFGVLCCHIFRVILNYDILEIPPEYVKRRWRRNIISEDHQRSRHGWVQKDNVTAELVNEAQSHFDFCIDKYVTDPEMLKKFVESQRLLKEECELLFSIKCHKRSKSDTFKDLLGVTVPEQIEIQVPSGIKNKGSGRSKRLIGTAEKDVISYEKQARLCGGCNKRVHGHNWRSCPVRKERESTTAMDT